MQHERIEERKYNVLDRMALVIFFSILWQFICPFLGFKWGFFEFLSTLFNLTIILISVEVSFEFVGTTLMVRSNGKYGNVDWYFKIFIWPVAFILQLCGLKNQPVLAYIVFVVFGIIPVFYYNIWPVSQFIYNTMVGVILYKNRKANK